MLSTRYIVVENEQTVFEFQQIQSSCVQVALYKFKTKETTMPLIWT